MTRQSAMADLQQQRRKYTLDCGFARNRRPLIKDLLTALLKIGGLMFFLIRGCAGNGIDEVMWACNQRPQLRRRKLHILTTVAVVTFSNIHYWVVGMLLPLLLLFSIRRGTLGPAGRPLDEYSFSKGITSDLPVSSYISQSQLSRKKAREDTGNFVLCLLENWSSAVTLALLWEAFSMIAAVRKQRMGFRVLYDTTISNIHASSRLLTRLGAAAALHQYPSLLFELRRADQPRLLCRSTVWMQRAVEALLRWLLLGVATDLAILVGTRKAFRLGVGVSVFSLIAPLCHLVSLRPLHFMTCCVGSNDY